MMFGAFSKKKNKRKEKKRKERERKIPNTKRKQIQKYFKKYNELKITTLWVGEK